MDGEQGEEQGHEQNVDDRHQGNQGGQQTEPEGPVLVTDKPGYFSAQAPAAVGRGIINKHQGRVKGVEQKDQTLADDRDKVDNQGDNGNQQADKPYFAPLNKINEYTSQGKSLFRS